MYIPSLPDNINSDYMNIKDLKKTYRQPRPKIYRIATTLLKEYLNF